MLSTGSIRPRLSLSKPQTIADWYNLSPILNVANWVLDSDGVGVVAAASSLMSVLYGVGANGKITNSMRFTSGTVDLRVMARLLTNQNASSRNDATYYWAGVTGTNFRLGKVVNGTFTTLATVAYTLSVNNWATFTLQCVGSSLVATIDDGITALTTLSASDSDIPGGGVFGFRSGPTNSCNIKCRSLVVEEVP